MDSQSKWLKISENAYLATKLRSYYSVFWACVLSRTMSLGRGCGEGEMSKLGYAVGGVGEGLVEDLMM